MTSYRGIIFDFDGTLADSVADIAASVNNALVKLGASALPLPEIQKHIGLGVTQLMQGSLGTERQNLVPNGINFFLEDYVAQCTQQTKWYDGVEETLIKLKKKFRLAIFTNKPKLFTQAILKKLKGEAFFEIIICGGDEGVPKKPDPTGIQIILDHWNMKPTDILFVGDSSIDMATAQNKGVHLAMASYGFGFPGGSPKCDYLLKSFDDLLSFVT